MGDKEYILFCDESECRGKYYSNFYGGVMVGSSHYGRIKEKLEKKKKELNLLGEIKWSKVTECYLEKYTNLIKYFFEDVISGYLRIRIMFTENAYEPLGLSPESSRNTYFMLYYQFVKHAYGLKYANLSNPANLRIYLDKLPHRKERIQQFKGYILGLNTQIKRSNLYLKEENIAEFCSHDHVLAQCMDVVLGAVAFHLNDKHLLDGKEKKKGKRTEAKEKLFQIILNEIRKLDQDTEYFNVALTTKIKNLKEKWSRAYLHWRFMPRNHKLNSDMKKPKE